MKNPYIEYKGKKYEFEANFKLKREFERERQNQLRKVVISKGISEKDYNEFNEIKLFIEENKEKGIEALNEKQKESLAKMFELLDTISLNELYEEYCFKMLNQKYGISKTEFEDLLEGLANEYESITFVDTFIQKVCEIVFTQVVENKQTKKALPDWMN